MTQRTKSGLGTQVSTLAADNTSGDISASDIRSLFTDTADSLVGGPASAVDNTLPRFDSTTGQLIQTSGIVVDDTDNMSAVASIALKDSGALKTTTTTAHTMKIQAYDVDGTAYKDFITLTNGNTPTMVISSPSGGTATIENTAIGGSTAAAGSFTTLATSGVTTHSDDVVVGNGKAIKSNTTTAHTMKIQAYDVDGTAYKDFITLTNGNTPTMVISSPSGGTATIESTAIGGTTPAAGAFTTLSATGNVTASTYVISSVGNTLTAAGTTRADALQLSKQINNVTTAASGTGVILPTGITAGMRIVIFNAGANPIKVYATGSETIDGTAGSTGVTLTNANRCEYFATSSTTWVSAKLGAVSS